MGAGLIVAIIVIVVAALAAYMFYTGGFSGLEIPGVMSEPAGVELPEEIAVDQIGATEASTQAEESVSDIEGEIAAADELELPDIE